MCRFNRDNDEDDDAGEWIMFRTGYQWTYQEDGHPRQTDVIKGDRPLKRIPAELGAICVILVPIYTRRIRRQVAGEPCRRCCGLKTKRQIVIRQRVILLWSGVIKLLDLGSIPF